MSQANQFLRGEGDEWFRRNLAQESVRDSLHFVEWAILQCAGTILTRLNLPICEVGSSRGDRVFRLASETSLPGIALDPSEEALAAGRSTFGDSVVFVKGTSSHLDFPSQSLGMVFFSFCLYLNPPLEFAQSIKEALRVLSEGGVLVVYDFDSATESTRPYKHLTAVLSYRRNYLSQILTGGELSLLAKIPLTKEHGFGLDPELDERTAIWVFQKI